MNKNKVVILGKNFIDVITKSVDKEDEENREVIKIIDKIHNSNIFSVYGENRKNIAMTISQVLKTTYEVFFEEQFKKLSNVNKKRIILLLKDNYLKKLFNKISNKNNRNQIEILKVDDFWNFIRTFYFKRKNNIKGIFLNPLILPWCRWTTLHIKLYNKIAWYISVCKILILICTVKVQ